VAPAKHPLDPADPGEFAPRREYVAVRSSDNREIHADAVVIATGLPATGHDWAPETLRGSAFFVPDPWAPGALETVRRASVGPADVLLVGTGLTRLVDSRGASDAPLWTLDALRRGGLWESTAVPEIRAQALGGCGLVLDTVAPLPRRLADGRLVSGHHPVARPRDPLGLPLSTTADAAAAYNSGLERVMRLQSGGDELLKEATLLDPDFALAHAVLAMLGTSLESTPMCRLHWTPRVERGRERETIGSAASSTWSG
jgi:hypothetical protein